MRDDYKFVGGEKRVISFVKRICVFVFVFAEKSWEQGCTLRCVEVGAGCRLECCVGSLPAKDEVQGHRSSGVQPNLLLSVPFTLHFAIYLLRFAFILESYVFLYSWFYFILSSPKLLVHRSFIILIIMPSEVLASLLIFHDKNILQTKCELVITPWTLAILKALINELMKGKNLSANYKPLKRKWTTKLVPEDYRPMGLAGW